jgi:enterochelin esterase-like enzyme
MQTVDSLKNGQLKLIFDCGTSDFFLTVNRRLHEKLLDKKIDHDYTERPGGHNSAYWRNSIDYQLLFFWKYFNGIN